MSQYIDIAVNLVGSPLENQLEQVITEAQAENVCPLIVIGSHIEESQRAIVYCQQRPQHLFTTVGVHPHHASEWTSNSSELLAELASHNNVVAIGECGLDFNRNFSPKAAQLEAFEAQLQLAANLNMPIYMHCRDAHNDFITLVKKYRARLKRAVLHCFTGSYEEMQQCIELDLHLGITGWVCDERRGTELAEVVKHIPSNRIMLETDSPYLLPRNLKPKPKSRTNYPKYLPVIATKIAKLRQEPLEDFSQQCFENTQAFFNLEHHL
ncbi:YchF/TatD family DNA exonuclease [Parashewanella spongiae]|uniref:YchF/TatD family DNA exonuclease n=1 Tax=Parashewanella spongiae TaxID=342950 RepID=A0A3A6TQC5_9GAMM|nr:TatD family hydrolase [Parashewanella spongiae]MCL1078467.1 YchF/TatD family DNA exonuclease [Parashewanella spongiae]RJY14610.1 YchF/TatD family DNA exonuclease [Parashewanella spongiae]